MVRRVTSGQLVALERSKLFFDLSQRWVGHCSSIGEHNRWHSLVTTIDLLDHGCSGWILLNVDLFEGNSFTAELSLEALAVAAPWSAVHDHEYTVTGAAGVGLGHYRARNDPRVHPRGAR